MAATLMRFLRFIGLIVVLSSCPLMTFSLAGASQVSTPDESQMSSYQIHLDKADYDTLGII